MIDPSCGTGHILVETLLAAYQAAAGGPCATWSEDGAQVAIDCDAAVQIAVNAVHGVDLEPYAALLAAYRLLTLTAALLDCTLAQVPADLSPHVASADALLGQHPLLERGQYHCVLGNPPYVTPKTATMRDVVRAAYPQVCHMKYALSLPFHALMNDLLLPGGWCAQLTANSFMKREFGKEYIEQYLPGYDLEWVIDTSGAYIPGHGTPTVILVNRNQPPTSDTVRSVLGILGEPKAPGDASQGLGWGDIARMRMPQRRLSPCRPRSGSRSPCSSACSTWRRRRRCPDSQTRPANRCGTATATPTSMTSPDSSCA